MANVNGQIPCVDPSNLAIFHNLGDARVTALQSLANTGQSFWQMLADSSANTVLPAIVKVVQLF